MEEKMKNQSEKIDALWQKSEDNFVIQGLKENRPIEEIYNSIDGIKNTFLETPECLACSDGRIHDHRIARAGSGIIAGEKVMIKAAGELIKAGIIKHRFEITSHEGCAAAKIALDELKKFGKLKGDITPDEFGQKYARDLVGSLNKIYSDTEFIYRHIRADEMEKLHCERVLYYDGTRKFKKIEGLPDGFIFTDMEIEPEESIGELIALSDVALSHGFGERFTNDNPFRIIVLGENEAQLEKLNHMAQVAVSSDNISGRTVWHSLNLEKLKL
ncbi:hypothetical protein CO115_01000 [Candidatus Falkowbacteria bacterium CG_4_9_14_3_um_filter_36_9]|uniref:Uncharacterized protein n=2 Tax=Candidatus Falkowiibacteriota TaxID=1752728 RepID=A0A1J4TAL9_9BACT|nr:MAG: hypothetical protein AUJ27_02800 [Candidatus Falkowbacteria bacterium CG1_02_37_44]PIV50728.1 MAG: hypothetical protein COS18_04140 [Candidatus Falkowbacteria bacterium CG02_land_8_20_14_3_00_36_14]PJA11341.1 MAG: hypothetical protein COX67_00230 [Candidatus Falkowbacteria bacterium CG_4_10_14_0_2_um_filter_36_22]PJB20582.1 MAG: hypothetical protein CO115_01000 [Candidatus Falkowbacteria bacterium CG_4_9_14_3_um_filter_36_9]